MFYQFPVSLNDIHSEIADDTEDLSGPVPGCSSARELETSTVTVIQDAPPSTVDFLTALRNNFSEIIVPLLDQKAREAFIAQKSPEEMSDIDGRRIKFSILAAVYGKDTFCYLHTPPPLFTIPLQKFVVTINTIISQHLRSYRTKQLRSYRKKQ